MKISVLESLFNKVDSKDIKEAQTQVFSCEYCEIFKNTFFTELLRWLLLLFLKNSYILRKTLVAEAQYIYIFYKYDWI